MSVSYSNITVPCDVDPGDTAWMMVACLLVLGMMPGLAFFEAGLLRAKNSISVTLQVLSGIMVLSTMWIIFGFTFTFGESLGGFIGNPADFPMLYSLQLEDRCLVYAENVPGIIFALFEMMFATITPLLQTGAFAERFQWKSYFVYIILWELFIYYPVAHWIWGNGWLSPTGETFGGNGVFDFAGGIVIHTTAGTSSLIGSIVLGRREGYTRNNNGRFPPSNILLACVGCAFLWIGWFGFNGGSALTSGVLSATAVVNTQIAASVCGLIWLILSWAKGHPSLVEAMNGAVGGLAGITPASGFITPPVAFAVSIILGFSSFFGVILLKDKLKIDDALDVTVVHGFTGALGGIIIGFCATRTVNPYGPDGCFYGSCVQIGYQVLGVSVAIVWSAVWTIALLFVLKRTIGIRVIKSYEKQGLDTVEHHEEGYGYLQNRVNILSEEDDTLINNN